MTQKPLLRENNSHLRTLNKTIKSHKIIREAPVSKSRYIQTTRIERFFFVHKQNDRALDEEKVYVAQSNYSLAN